MAGILTALIMIVWVILAPSAWADSDLDIELAKAKVIVTKADELEKAKKALEGLTGDALDKKSKEVKELEASLEKTVKSAFVGTPFSRIAYSRQLLQRKEIVDQLTAKKQAETDVTKLPSLQKSLELAESDLQKSIVETSEQDKLKKDADQRFAGFGFGVALGVVSKAGRRDVIQSASLDANGIVRVDRDANTTANLILESHYFFTPELRFLPWVFDATPGNWGHGPFIAIQPGTQNIIESVGVGWMLGFKRSSIVAPDLARDRGDSFNLGLGIMVNPNAQVLGDGITKNQVLPAGETAVRLKSTTELGWLFVFSYSF